MASGESLRRFCVKLYAREHAVDDHAFVPLFHEWIRERALEDAVAVDVADYAHVPDGPGIMLVTYATSFALDRSDGRFGLLAQRRTPAVDEAGADGLAGLLAEALRVAELLEGDPRLAGRLSFDRSAVRVESNDRLRAPNTDEGFRTLEPLAREAVGRALAFPALAVRRIANDPRDRLAVEVRLAGGNGTGAAP